MAEIKIIQPYTDIETAPFEPSSSNQDLTNVRTLQAGYGGEVMRMDKSGLWLGAARFADAPFSVDMAGNLIATSVTVSGYIPTGGAASDVNAGATTVSGGKLTAGSVSADKISVSTLSALSANIGSVTAGSISGVTITGSLFRTAVSGERIEIDTTNTNQIRFYTGSTLYGMLEVDEVGTDGFVRLMAYDSGAGMEINTGIGASGFNEVAIFSNGGTFTTGGSASIGVIGFEGKNGGQFYISSASGVDTFETDIESIFTAKLKIPVGTNLY